MPTGSLVHFTQANTMLCCRFFQRFQILIHRHKCNLNTFCIKATINIFNNYERFGLSFETLATLLKLNLVIGLMSRQL